MTLAEAQAEASVRSAAFAGVVHEPGHGEADRRVLHRFQARAGPLVAGAPPPSSLAAASVVARARARLDCPMDPPRLYVVRSDGPVLWIPRPDRSDQIRRGPGAQQVEINPLRASPDPEDLGLPRLTYEQVLHNISTLPFEPAIAHISALAAEVFHHSDDAEYQLKLAEELYDNQQLLTKLRWFVESEPGMLVFDERYVTVLQRLLIEHAAPTDGAIGLTGSQTGVLLTSLLAVPGIVSSQAPDAPPPPGCEEEQLDDWTAFILQGGAYYEKPDLGDAIARAHALYCELARDPRFTDHPDACPLEEWIGCDYGVGLSDQLAAGFAAAIVSKATQPTLGLTGRKLALQPGWLGAGPLGDREVELVAGFSAAREELRDAFANAGTTRDHVSWDRAPLEQRPFLQLEDGRLFLLSPRMLFSWFTAGVYYRLLDAANARPRPDRPEKTMLTRFTGYVGALSEEYAVRVTREALCPRAAARGTRVHGDLEYALGKDRKRSPDIAVDDGEELVLVEVFSGRLPRLARVLADEQRISDALRKVIIGKLDELSRATEDVLAGAVPYPEFDPNAIRRVWPVLVLAGGGIVQQPVLLRYVERRTAEGAFADERIAPRTIATLDDYEPLLSLSEERGASLSAVLAEYHASGHAEQPPRNWVRVVHRRAGPTRPKWVQSCYLAATSQMKTRLGVEPEAE
jgi:hypothetical protein